MLRNIQHSALQIVCAQFMVTVEITIVDDHFVVIYQSLGSGSEVEGKLEI